MPAVILLCFGLVYLGLPTYDYYFDGLTFAMAVEGVAAGGDSSWLFHPHHLLYSPLAFGFYELFLALGLEIRALLAMQILSAGLALAGLALFYRLARGLGLSIPAAGAGTVLLGSCYTFWHFGTQGDTTMPVTVILLALTHLCSRGFAASARTVRSITAGLLLGGGVLIHQTACLFAPAAGYAIWYASRPDRRKINLAAFIGTAAGLPLAAYLVVALWLGSSGLGGARDWLLGYFAADPRTGYKVVYGSWKLEDLAASASAWAASFVGNWPYPPGAGAVVWRLAAGIFLAALLVLSARGAWRALRAPVREARTPGNRLAMSLLIWIIIHAVFFTWWKAGHVRFWLLALPAWLLLALFGLCPKIRTRSGPQHSPGIVFALSAAILVLVGSGPFRYEFNPANNLFLAAAGNLERNSAPDGIIIISGVGRYGALKAYIPYFSQRRMLILDWQFPDKDIPPERGLARLEQRIRSLAQAGPVYLLSETMAPEIDGHFLKLHGISGDRRRSVLESFNPRPLAEISPGLILLKL